MKNELRHPDLQVTVAASQWEVAVISFYRIEGTQASYDVLVGVDEGAPLDAIIDALQSGVEAIKSSSGKYVSDGDVPPLEGNANDLPF